MRHRRLVLAAWGVALMVALVVGRRLPATYHADYQTPGAEATRAFDLLSERFPERRGDTIMVVFAASQDLSAHRSAIEARLAAVAAFPHVASVNSPFAPAGEPQWAKDRKTAFALVNLDRTIDKLANIDAAYQRKFLHLVRPGTRDGLQVEVTSFVESFALGNESIALVFAALVLCLAFGSLLAAGLPILTAVFGLAVGTVIGGVLTHVIATPDWATTVATMIGLGVGIDYALLIVTRYRRALAAGLAPPAAVRLAMATAGRSVLFAGVVVMLSLLGMAAMRLGYANGVLVASVIAVAVMLAASLTLLPALLGMIAHRIDRFRLPFFGAGPAPEGTGMWHRWSRTVQRRPWTALAVATLLLAVCTLPLRSLRLGLPDDGNRPVTETSRRAYDLLTRAFGPGINGPLMVVVDARGTEPSPLVLFEALEKVQKLKGVAFVLPYVSPSSRDTVILNVFPKTSPQSRATEQLVETLRHQVIPEVLKGTGIKAVVGGFTAISLDQGRYIKQRLAWFIGAVLLLSFLLLTVVFQSPVVAFKAGVMNLLSIMAAYGVMAYAVNGTWLGRILGIHPTPVPAFVPMIMFAVLFGLSMDYEVFLLSHIREEYLRSGDNSTAVADGLAATARVISAAAAIMVFVFAVFIFDPNVFIKQIGLGLSVAVLVDATIVRMVLVPAAMELLGKVNWWMPRWLARSAIRGTEPDEQSGSELEAERRSGVV